MSERPTTEEWAAEHPEEVALLDRFRDLMLTELAANNGKGNRPGWLQMDRKQAMAEIGWHLAKLQVAAKALAGYQERGEDDRGEFSEVREYGADVANCALMALDVLGLFGDDLA